MKPKSGEEVTIKAKIENIGKEKVTTGFVVSFRLEIILIGYINISSLDIGESIEVKQIWIARAGNYNISIIADEKNFVKEMNETNNKYRLGIFVSGEPGPGVPDLVVKSVEYEPKEIKNAKLFIAGGLFVRTVNVLEIDTENISDKEVVYKVNADYEITTNVSNVEISFKGKATIHIKGNRTVDGENITWKGFVYLKFIGIGKIKTPTRTIEVVGVLTVFGTGAFIKKDGNFTLALFGGILFEIGKVVTIKAKIANIGLGNVDKSFIVSFILDGKVIAKEEVEGLAMGGETEVVVYAYADDFTILPYHRLFVLADSSFVITEANEKNNLFVLTIPTVSILRGLWCNVILTPDYASGTVSILVKSNVSLELLFITIALPNGENITINLTTLDQHVWFGKFSITIAGIHNITLTGITKDGEIISQVVHTIQRKVQEIKAKIIAIIEEENITLKLLTKVNVTDVGITISRSAYHRGEINITTKRGMLIRSANIYVQVSVTIDPSNTSSIRIEIKIDVDALTYLNLSKLKLFYYNETSGEWEIIIESGIDLEKGIVWANLTHLSTLGVFESEYSAPIAKIKANDGKIGEKIIADASDSYDPNGLPLKFQFDFGDGTKTEWLDSTKAEHIYTKEGKYNVKVSVSNGYITSDATIEINIASAVNLPPKAVIKKPIL
ncbi:MAG: CARDB domain-containing protein, partial [Candidatus Thermoplasmatota archaeon]